MSNTSTTASSPAEISTFRLRRRTPGSFVLVPCPKMGRSIRCQGQLEAAAAVTLANCPSVHAIQEQPLAIWYAWRETAGGIQIQLLDGKPHKQCFRKGSVRCGHIVPDFLVEMRSKVRRLVEVKPAARLKRPLVQRKLAVARLYATKQGWSFHVVTERELFAGPLLANLRLLGRYRRLTADSAHVATIEKLVPASGIRLDHLLPQQAGHGQDTRAAVLHLLAVERLSFDPRLEPLGNQTMIFPGGVIPWDPFDSPWAPSGCSTGAPTEWFANRRPTDS